MSYTPPPGQAEADRAACLAALARGLTPDPLLDPVEWGQRHFTLPDGPRRGELWDVALTPYAAPILRALSADSPHTKVAVMKSAQTGLSTLGLVWLGYLIDSCPDTMLVVQPTIQSARDFNRLKLDPALRASHRLRRKVRDQSLRSAQGSTTLFKRFSGGSLLLVGANSPADLRGKTIRFALCDEVDAWPSEIDGEGDPMGMVDARQIAYTRAATHKKLVISTPTIRGSSRIERDYAAGDQRKWTMPCPHCGSPVVFEPQRLHFAPEAPHRAHYVPPCCGAIIDSAMQLRMVQAGDFIATRPGEGRYPSFHLGSLTSMLTSWDAYAAAKVAAMDDPAAYQKFVNEWDGEPFDLDVADTPADAIVAACEDYAADAVPPRVGRLVLTVDLNGEWAEWAVHGFGPSLVGAGVDQWLVATGKIPGRPDDETLWSALAELERRAWPHAGGKALPADLMGVDTGYGTHEVYRFVRGRPRARALDGRPQRVGNPKAALPLGTPSRVQAKDRHDRPLFKVWLYPVGGHDLKIWLADALRRYAVGDTGSNALHLPRALVDQAYADQLTGEVLVKREGRGGYIERRWEKRRGIRNEALDLAVYARALALGPSPNGLGVDRITPDQWAAILADRHAPATPAQAELDGLLAPPVPAPPRVAPPALPRRPQPPSQPFRVRRD